MNAKKNARTTTHIRLPMIQRVLKECPTPKSVATDFGVSVRTMYTCLAGYCAEGPTVADRDSVLLWSHARN